MGSSFLVSELLKPGNMWPYRGTKRSLGGTVKARHGILQT